MDFYKRFLNAIVLKRAPKGAKNSARSDWRQSWDGLSDIARWEVKYVKGVRPAILNVGGRVLLHNDFITYVGETLPDSYKQAQKHISALRAEADRLEKSIAQNGLLDLHTRAWRED